MKSNHQKWTALLNTFRGTSRNNSDSLGSFWAKVSAAAAQHGWRHSIDPRWHQQGWDIAHCHGTRTILIRRPAPAAQRIGNMQFGEVRLVHDTGTATEHFAYIMGSDEGKLDQIMRQIAHR